MNEMITGIGTGILGMSLTYPLVYIYSNMFIVFITFGIVVGTIVTLSGILSKSNEAKEK
jgi:hypothetical protein